jgi:hypothetical protein
MMTKVTSNSSAKKAAIYIFAILLFLLSGIGAFAQETRELVVVIDISTSMQDMFHEAKIQAKQLVSSAQIGDRITIITFGERSYLVERSRIRSSYDIARLITVVEELEATEYSTNLPAGMERGLNELRRFYEESPDSSRVLMWLSDDKDNPPDIPDIITFATLKEQQSGKLPDKSWFKFERPIEPEAKSDTKWFIDWISRSEMQLSVELLTKDLGTLLAPDLERELRLRFSPSTEAIRGTSFSVVAEVTAQGGKPYSEAIPVFPSKIVCRGESWEQDLRIMFPNRAGNYVCRISLVLPSDKLLAISPPQLSLRGKVQAEIKMLQRQQVAAIDKAMRAGFQQANVDDVSTQRALASRERAELSREGGLSSRITRLLFGPIGARGQYQVTALLTPTQNLPVETIGMKSSFRLPVGLDFRPELEEGWELKGDISFYAGDGSISIYPETIPVRFYADKGTTRWGRKELDREPMYNQFAKVMGIAKTYLVFAGKGFLGVVAFWFLVYVIRRYGFGMTELVGSLEIVKNPGENHLKNINLRRMGKRRATNSLTVGSSDKADIVLPHDSLADWHAKITTARTDAGTVVFVQPLHHNQIFVNDIGYTRRKEIGDKDILSIGDYTFLYRCPEIQRETIVRFADGRAMRGVLVSWDIDSSAFEFLPKGAPSLEARMAVDFAELKAVFFIRKASRFSGDRIFTPDRRPSGRPVEVIFKDGELLEGYMVGEASEWSKRFYLIPRERGEVALVLIEHSAVQNIFMRDAFDKEPLDLVGAVKNLIGRNGE